MHDADIGTPRPQGRVAWGGEMPVPAHIDIIHNIHIRIRICEVYLKVSIYDLYIYILYMRIFMHIQLLLRRMHIHACVQTLALHLNTSTLRLEAFVFQLLSGFGLVCFVCLHVSDCPQF